MRRPPPDAERRFEVLWQDHSPAVLRYARRRVHPDDVEEVLAETFVVAWRRLDDVPPFALPWLLGVARHVAANTRRSGLRRDALAERTAALTAREGLCAGDGQPGGGDDEGRVTAALDSLREADRELLMLLAWDGLDHAQAAEALGCSRGALAVRLHRARQRFRTALGRAPQHDTSSDPPRVRPLTTAPRLDPTGGPR